MNYLIAITVAATVAIFIIVSTAFLITFIILQ